LMAWMSLDNSDLSSDRTSVMARTAAVCCIVSANLDYY
jgi:hypothetical protein